MRSLPQVFQNEHAAKCELAGEVLRSSGRLRLGVTGWSMLPSVRPGDTLVIESADEGAVSEGDIVLFMRERRLCVHRVVKKNRALAGTTILTRGDAMQRPDPPVSDCDLLGKVTSIVRNGKHIEPQTPRLAQRAVSALVRNSEFAARVVVGVHGMRQKLLN